MPANPIFPTCDYCNLFAEVENNYNHIFNKLQMSLMKLSWHTVFDLSMFSKFIIIMYSHLFPSKVVFDTFVLYFALT